MASFSGSRPTLVLLDLQRDFLEASGRMRLPRPVAERDITVANRLMAHAVRHQWAVVLVRNEFGAEQWLGNFFRRGAAVAGASGAELDPRIAAPPGSRVLGKRASDAFSNPDFERALAEGGAGGLVVGGLMTEGCVRATVAGARSRGLATTVVVDGLGAAGPMRTKFGLWSMRRAGARLMSSDKLLAEPLP